jgi:hypothetical protein
MKPLIFEKCEAAQPRSHQTGLSPEGKRHDKPSQDIIKIVEKQVQQIRDTPVSLLV